MSDFAEKFVKDRCEAFTAAVMNDDWDKVKMYMKKYKMPTTDNPIVLKGAIYWAVQECTDIPKEVKSVAMQKCVALGLKPFVRWDSND